MYDIFRTGLKVSRLRNAFIPQNKEQRIPVRLRCREYEDYMENKNKWTPKRICAILCIIFLVTIYLGTLIVAIFAPEAGGKLFAMCLFATVIVPIVAYIYIWIYTQATGKRTIASRPEVPGEKEARDSAEVAETVTKRKSEDPDA